MLHRYALAWLQNRRQFGSRQLPRTCPICGFHGIFVAAGHPPRWNARCPSCDSRERHRHAFLLYREIGLFEDTSLKILHFAPERFMASLMRGHSHYVTTDPKMPDVARTEDIRAIADPGSIYDIVIAHHVLEHIDDDDKALSSIAF